MPNLLILSKLYPEYKSLIEAANLPGLTIFTTSDPAQALQHAADSEIIFGEPSLLCQVINQLPGLRWVQSAWAGVEPLLKPGLRRDYTLTNIRHVYGPLMSEYVFGYLLLIERRILSRWQSQMAGRWDASPHGTLQGKQLGLLGVGSIGSYLAGTARHFGMRVRGYTYHSESSPDIEQYFHGNTLPDFASGLDYLVCTLPGTATTRHIVDAALLAALPPHAWLVNIGRGSAIDDLALAEALHAGQLAGAVLDVFETEPLPPEHPLWHTPNTFITAHTAAINYPPDIAAVFINNYPRYLRGEPLLGLVDFNLGY
ncbi:MAG: D-2-hydroxyacid dehydrogenase [Anaerolineales bacterium]|nr:D-2-hydroxyacid dehydrogenase [Anaerolineales bacterium]